MFHSLNILRANEKETRKDQSQKEKKMIPGPSRLKQSRHFFPGYIILMSLYADTTQEKRERKTAAAVFAFDTPHFHHLQSNSS
jgi:hypothetical protein